MGIYILWGQETSQPIIQIYVTLLTEACENQTDKERRALALCLLVCESLLRCWALVCGAQHLDNCLPAPASSFQGQPAPVAARTAALCSGCQADSIPVPGSARTPSAQHKYCVACWLFRATHGSAWKWKEAQSREVSREELGCPCFSGITLSFSCACERKRIWLPWFSVGRDPEFLVSFALSQHQAAECFSNL